MNLETIFQGPITEAKWRMLGDYLRSTRLHPGNGVRIQDSYTSGRIISAIPARQPRQNQSPPFSVIKLYEVPDSSPAQYKATLQEGFVIERDTTSGNDGVVEHECNIGATAMSARPQPELTLVDGDFVICKYDTDSDGFVTGTPEVLATQTDTPSIHHQPASGAGSTGESGDYRVKLFKFTIVSGSPTITYYQQSDVEHSRLWKGRNVGGARYIHKKRDKANDSYDFRTLEQNEPSGRTYGKIIVPFVNGDEFDDANDSIKFSAIAERATSPQVNVSDDGAGIVTIEGNDKDGSLTWTNCATPTPTVTTLIEWEDGLITTSGIKNFTAGCGDEFPSASSGDMLYYNGTNWVVLANPGVASNEGWVLTHNGTNPVWVDTTVTL